jgi:GH24 family phage-related lysozyme (muramidase)
MSFEELKDRIKKHEGYRVDVYKCSEGFDTGGYGHKIIPGEDIPTTEEGWNKLFEKDFQTACEGADRVLGDCDIDTTAKEVVIEMVYQMGEGGVSKFKGMLSALKEGNYTDASDEMIDSLWYRQTPNRASELALTMREIDVA